MKNYRLMIGLFWLAWQIPITNASGAEQVYNINNFMPLNIGTTWTYRVNSTNLETMTLSGPETINGKSVSILSGTGKNKLYMYSDTTGLYRVKEANEIATIVYLTPVKMGDPNMTIGSEYKSSGNAELTYNSSTATINYNSTFRVEGIEVFTNAIGNFNALKVKLTNNITGIISGSSVTITITETDWLVEGVGNARLEMDILAKKPGTTVQNTSSYILESSSISLTNPVNNKKGLLNVDKSTVVDTTDGVLILRRLNGASTIDTGVSLPAGQSNSSVVTTIDALGTALDVDNNSRVEASDGVLILRRLHGDTTIDTGLVLPAGQSNSTVMTTIDAMK